MGTLTDRKPEKENVKSVKNMFVPFN